MTGIRCPTCKNDTEVVDSRPDRGVIRRRRRCVNCKARFSTVEKITHSKTDAQLMHSIAVRLKAIATEVDQMT